jgi:uncharacterized membrane protein YeiH
LNSGVYLLRVVFIPSGLNVRDSLATCQKSSTTSTIAAIAAIAAVVIFRLCSMSPEPKFTQLAIGLFVRQSAKTASRRLPVTLPSWSRKQGVMEHP